VGETGIVFPHQEVHGVFRLVVVQITFSHSQVDVDQELSQFFKVFYASQIYLGATLMEACGI
jgi:hypothetical protein